MIIQLEEFKEQRESLRKKISGIEVQVKIKGEATGTWIERRITRLRKEDERLDDLIQKSEERKLD